MEWSLLFFLNSALLGVGLSMDAFSVSLADGLHEPDMTRKKMSSIAGVFAFFQAAMPMTGWICVHMFIRYFTAFQKLVPWIALALLLFIGGKMFADGIKGGSGETEKPGTDMTALLLQGIAKYGFVMAFVCALIIAVVTFVICMAGLDIGKKFGTKYSDKAALLGGTILILIGIEIFVTGVF